jgi:NAD(P)-dependent dehydrogenase (short-subunit alcohol dehydrogenase family)
MKMEYYDWESMPVVVWDLLGEQGHPIRTTIYEMGPLLLSRLMGLNDTQEGVLTIAFRYADEHDLLLLDLEDLQAMLAWCADNADELSSKYGNVTKASVGSIQRQLLTLDSQGGAAFFGEPAFDILVNAAGRVDGGTILEVSDRVWDLAFDLNVRSMHRMTAAALPLARRLAQVVLHLLLDHVVARVALEVLSSCFGVQPDHGRTAAEHRAVRERLSLFEVLVPNGLSEGLALADLLFRAS